MIQKEFEDIYEEWRVLMMVSGFLFIGYLQQTNTLKVYTTTISHRRKGANRSNKKDIIEKRKERYW